MKSSRRQNIQIVQVQPNADTKDGNQRSTNLNFAITFRPIYYFLRLFGFMPFTIVYDSKGEVQAARITARDILWLLISLCAYLLAFNGSKIWENPYLLHKYSTVFIYVIKLYDISEILFGIIGIVMDLCNRFKLIDIMRTLNQFDKEVN